VPTVEGAITLWPRTDSVAPARRTSQSSIESAPAATNGTLACWGFNPFGQATPPAGTYTAVAAGGGHSCAVKTNGTLACWGANNFGQATPPAGTYTAVAAGTNHSCAVKTSGRAFCWGDNGSGQTAVPAGFG
jgi:alpha-tubulin suppressor-like RCC1 family protein